MRVEIIQARDFLAGLRPGDPVRLLWDGKQHDLTVQRPLRTADPGGFGSLESQRVTIGYGPGRWNTEVTVERLAGAPDLLVRRQS